MQFLIRAILLTGVPIAIGFLIFYIDKNNRKQILENLNKEHIVIRLPQAYLLLGCIDIIFFVACTVLMVWFPNNTATEWVWMTFVLFIILGITLIIIRQIWKIDVFKSENYFLYRSVFFRKYRILYCDCISYELKTHSLVLKTRGRVFHIDGSATDIEFLLAMLTRHKVKSISE